MELYLFYVYFWNFLLLIILNVPFKTSFETFLSALLNTKQANGITCPHHILKILCRTDTPLYGLSYKIIL